MSSTVRFLCVLLWPVGLALASGCSQFNLNRPIPWLADDQPQAPIKIVPIWSSTVLHQSNQPPVRGFGGRLMFYGPEDKKPVKVDGSLVVYAFDEQKRSPADPKPDRKYVFKAEYLSKHYSESKLGHSYSFWMPWDEAGGSQKEISLICRFIPKDGPVVIGEQTKQILQGRSPPPAVEHAKYSPGIQDRRVQDRRVGDQYVQSASYDETLPPRYARGEERPGAQAHSRTPQMATATISIPPQFGRRSPVAAARTRRTRSELTPPVSPVPTTEPSSRAREVSLAPPRSTRYSLSRSRPLGEPIARLTRDRAP